MEWLCWILVALVLFFLAKTGKKEESKEEESKEEESKEEESKEEESKFEEWKYKYKKFATVQDVTAWLNDENSHVGTNGYGIPNFQIFGTGDGYYVVYKDWED